MTSHDPTSAPLRVLVAGGGVAGLEAVLALRELAGDRVDLTLLTPDTEFRYVPLSVREPFAGPSASTHSVERLAADIDVRLRIGSLAWVAPGQHLAFGDDGSELPYDVLVIALGARREPAYERVVNFRGGEDSEAMHGLVQDIEGGWSRRVAFVVPPGVTWPLPMYELALQTAARARSMNADVELTVVTPEAAPLDLFGSDASEAVARLLDEAGVSFEGGVEARIPAPGRVELDGDRVLETDRIVALPRLFGRAPRGLPSDVDGFIPVDRRGRVVGVENVYAAGDGIQSPVKQGGIASQQADRIAEVIARRAGADIELGDAAPTLRGMLLTGGEDKFLRGTGTTSEASSHALWWPPAKIAGRYLAPYLAGPAAVAGASSDEPTTGLDVEVGLESGTKPRVRRRAAISVTENGQARITDLPAAV